MIESVAPSRLEILGASKSGTRGSGSDGMDRQAVAIYCFVAWY